jgi:hypothetical protein
MATNFKQQTTAEYFAEAIKREAVDGNGAAVVTKAVVGSSGDFVTVTLNNGDASTVGSAVVAFGNQRGYDDSGFKALPGFGSVAQPIYTSGVALVVTEEGAAGDFPFTVGYATFNAIFADLARRGLKIEHWTIANASLPSSVDFSTYTGALLTNCTKKGSFEPSPGWTISDRV